MVAASKTITLGGVTRRFKCDLRRGNRRVMIECECGHWRYDFRNAWDAERFRCYKCHAHARLNPKANTGGSPEYKCWHNMLRRCYSETCDCYRHYGGRGIKVCARWRSSYAKFYADMGPRPGKGYSIDRIDNDGDYTPRNCRWATAKQQSNNQRPRTCMKRWGKRYEFNGESLTVAEWSQKLGVENSVMRHRLQYWPIEDAIAGRKPVKPPKAKPAKEQRPLPTIAFNGTEASIEEWATALGLGVPGLKARLRRLPVEQALSKPRYVHTKFYKAS